MVLLNQANKSEYGMAQASSSLAADNVLNKHYVFFSSYVWFFNLVFEFVSLCWVINSLVISKTLISAERLGQVENSECRIDQPSSCITEDIVPNEPEPMQKLSSSTNQKPSKYEWGTAKQS